MAKQAQSLKKWQQDNREDGTRGNGFTINPLSIIVRDNFNARDTDVNNMTDKERAEFEAYIDGLAQAYSKGDFVPAIVVKMIDGQPNLLDGHCRRLGMLRAIEVYGADLKRVAVEDFKGDDADEVALIATSNSNRKLKPLELSQVYVRLTSFGLTDAEIAEKMGKTVPHVAQVKFFSQLPVALKTMIKQDQIAVQTAVDLFQEHGTRAFDIATGMLKKAAQSGGKAKVTNKIAQPKMSSKERRTLNTTASKLHNSIKDIKIDDSATSISVDLSPELLRQLQEITARANEIENFDAASHIEDEAEESANIAA
jgi:hypothetical protein